LNGGEPLRFDFFRDKRSVAALATVRPVAEYVAGNATSSKLARMATTRDEMLTLVAQSPPIARKLAEIGAAEKPVRFSHVIESAQGFLVATIAEQIRQPIWVVAPNVRAQELFYENVLNWIAGAAFFPEAEFAAVENILPDPEIAAERLALLTQVERGNGPKLIVTTRAALDQPAPKIGALKSASLELRRGQILKMDHLLSTLSDAHYERGAQVTARGQFAVRGGIVDIFSWQSPVPLRVEFFGDEIESLREFDVDTQTSVRTQNRATVLLGAAEDAGSFVRDYIKPSDLMIELEPEEKSIAQIQIGEGWIEEGPENFDGSFQECDVGEFSAGDFMLAEAKRAQFASRLGEWGSENARVAIYFQTEGEIERFREIISPDALAGVDLLEGTLGRGFCFPAANIVVLSANELIGRFPVHGRRRLQRAERRRSHCSP
jgi:transcription-repair coupling factor (superfamily II helicase)